MLNNQKLPARLGIELGNTIDSLILRYSNAKLLTR